MRTQCIALAAVTLVTSFIPFALDTPTQAENLLNRDSAIGMGLVGIHLELLIFRESWEETSGSTMRPWSFTLTTPMMSPKASRPLRSRAMVSQPFRSGASRNLQR